MKDYYQSWRCFHDEILECYNKWYALLGLMRTICYYVAGGSLFMILLSLILSQTDGTLITIGIILITLSGLMIALSYILRQMIGEKMEERIKELDKRRNKNRRKAMKYNKKQRAPIITVWKQE